MHSRSVDPAGSTDLCTSCGLCCAGVLFDTALVDADEIEPMTRLGFEPYIDERRQARIDLPCCQLQGTLCAVYADRPRACREFSCEVLKKYEGGELTGAEAHSLVDEAMKMIDDVRPLVVESGGSITPKNWGALLDSWSAETQAGEPTQLRARVVLELARLNRFLDRHFRSRDQQVVRPKP